MSILATLKLSDYLKQEAYGPIRVWIEYDLRRSIEQVNYLNFSQDIEHVSTIYSGGYVHKKPGAISVTVQFDDRSFTEDLNELKARYNSIIFKRAMRKKLKEQRRLTNESRG